MASKLDKIGADLKKAIQKRDEWDARAKELEKKYRETENTMIHDMVHAANITPEQLAELIKKASVSVPNPMNEFNGNDEEETRDED
ncbi:MAG: DUF4315 family protein [Lachnospiraceae bacterium]|jgi:hypothetical protein